MCQRWCDGMSLGRALKQQLRGVPLLLGNIRSMVTWRRGICRYPSFIPWNQISGLGQSRTRNTIGTVPPVDVACSRSSLCLDTYVCDTNIRGHETKCWATSYFRPSSRAISILIRCLGMVILRLADRVSAPCSRIRQLPR